MTKTKRNHLINSLQHFLSYSMSQMLMGNGKAQRIKSSTRGKLRVEERLVIQWSNKPLWNQSTQENESIYQKLNLKPALLNRNPHKHIKLSQNLQILKPLILHPSCQSSPKCKPKYQRASTATACLLVLKNYFYT